jgi:hypothetical protein
MTNKRRPLITAVMMLLAISNYFRLDGHENISAIQFITIFAIGLLSGILLKQLFENFRK